MPPAAPSRRLAPSKEIDSGPDPFAGDGRSHTSPAVDVRVVFFTLVGGRLVVALGSGEEGAPSLPRGWPAAEESLDVAARRIARDQIGLTDRYLEQLYTFSVGDDGEWTVVITYVGLVGPDAPVGSAPGITWVPLHPRVVCSEIDSRVIEYARTRLQAKLGYTTIALYLLPAAFTFRHLQSIYETILDQPLDKRNFRRRFLATGMLERTDQVSREGSHRPAALYRFRPTDDHERYLTPAWDEERP